MPTCSASAANDRNRARRAAAFSIWTAAGVSLLYGIALFLTQSAVLPAVGADAVTDPFCRQYLFWTVTAGALPTVLSQTLAHLVRAEGHSSRASFGIAMGGILNIGLDPVFIFLFDMEIAGAALATMLSNVAATLYFIVVILRMRGTTDISFSPRHYTLGQRIPREVLLVGIPSCLMNLMGVLSNITLNKLMSSYSNAAIAGVGVAKKIDMLSFAIATGMSQGALPLIGYNYSARNFRRMKAALRVDFLMSFCIALVSTLLLFTCAGPVVKIFINDPETVHYGQIFQRIICITGPCISVTMLTITSFQSVGKKLQSTLLSLLRKGALDIPFMFLLDRLAGAEGIVWATPLADFGAMSVAVLLFIPFWRHLTALQRQTESAAEPSGA